MSNMTFQMRMHCSYTGDKNAVDKLTVEHLVGDKWLTLDLDISSPGFDIFTYSILTCQHMYFRANATESGLILSTCDGQISITTDAHRSIDSLSVDFTGKLRSGDVTQEKMEYISQRMDQCPVSINLKQIDDRQTSVKFKSK
jgi:uncharacterized OsmC-like protein